MKIAHISTYVSNGGAAIAAVRVHQGLMKESNIESSIVQKYPEDRSFMSANNIFIAQKNTSLINRVERKLKIDVESKQEKIHHLSNPKWENISFARSNYRLDMHPIVKEADIIHLHWVADFLDYPTFFKNIKQPIVWTLHDMNPFQGIFHYKNDEIENQYILGDIDKENLKIKQHSIHNRNNITIVTPSAWLGNLSKGSNTFSRYNHLVVPYGLNMTNFPYLDKTEVKKKIGINNSLKTILFVSAGVDKSRKGMDLLLKAINSLDKTNYNLVSVGQGKIDICEKINHIHLGQITDTKKLNEIYTAADLTIIPSREDNLPNVMLESFANGTPVMSFSNGGMAEHVKTGETGILIQDITSEALKKGLEDYLDGIYVFDNNYIRNYTTLNFVDSLQTESYFKLYNSLLNK